MPAELLERAELDVERAARVQTGADLERIVLLRAVRWHLEDRVLVHGNRTIVFR